MTEVTVNSRTDSVFGNYRAVIVNADVTDAYTLTTGYNHVWGGTVMGPDETAMGYTASGGTVIFQIGGTPKAGCRAFFLCN